MLNITKIKKNDLIECISQVNCEESLYEFSKKAWEVVEPGTTFIDNWHIKIICAYLEAVRAREIRNLIITVPPRHMKSLLVSVFWPVWCWIKEPGLRWIFSSYSGDLAIRDSVKCRRIIESDWYKKHWGKNYQLTSDQNVKSRFENNKTGFRMAAGVGGSITGEGGDFIVCDDPHNLKEIHSDLKRETVISWWREVMSTRLNDPKRSCRVIVMQRGHQADLVGSLLEQGLYEHLNLRGIAETDESIKYPCSDKVETRKAGEVLWEERFPREILDDLRTQLGTAAFSAQIQQRPTALGGGIIKGEWFIDYKDIPEDGLIQTIQSWDTAFKEKEGNDYSVCTTWKEYKHGYYLIDIWRKRVEYPELLRAAEVLYKAHRPGKVLIEDKASGQSLIQSLKRDTSLPIFAIKVDRDKVSRANSISPAIESGNVYVNKKAHWYKDFEIECENFPNGAHDDQVDSLTQGLTELLKLGQSVIRIAGIRDVSTNKERDPRSIIHREPKSNVNGRGSVFI